MTSAETSTRRSINLLDGHWYAGDPYDDYAWLRANDPIYRDEINSLWGISRYEDVLAIEKNPALYSSASGSRPLIDMSNSMINMDDPAHQQQRLLVAREFTPRAVKKLEGRIRAIVTELIDNVCERGWCDLVHELAAPLPAVLIGEKLGYPTSIWRDVMEWSEATMQGGGGPGFHTVRGDRAIESWYVATAEIMEARRTAPQDDLISMWLTKEVDGQPLDDAEVMQEVLLVLDGGAETTRTVIGSATLALLQQPDQLQLLRERPEILGDTGVEEFIRFVTPILNMRRTVVADHELHGKQLRAGDQLLLMYSSANRDPEVFDEPDRINVLRAHNQHVAFGFGTHFCLGASLARVELRIMFEEVLRRLPDLRLEPWFAPQIQPGAFTRGLTGLRVEFTPTEREGDGALGLF